MSDCSTRAFDVPLKPCPFCGGKAHVNEHYSFPGYERTGIYPDYLPLGYTVGCSTFDCRGKRENSGFMYETEAEAIAAWNTRAVMGYEDARIMLDELGLTERTCRIEERFGDWYCICCGEMVGTCDTTSELYIDGNAIRMWHYCPNCGAKVVGE